MCTARVTLVSVFLGVGTDAQCIGHFKLIFSLLRMTQATKLQKFALEVRQKFVSNEYFLKMKIVVGSTWPPQHISWIPVVITVKENELQDRVMS